MSSRGTIGRYRLLERLAAGGMGEVFLAVQETGVAKVERLCVVKTVHPDLVDTPMAITRFIDEAGTSLLLTHPNLCVTFDVQRLEDTLLIAMEYIDGVTVRQIENRLFELGRQMDVDNAVAIVIAVLTGLEYAHNLKNMRTGESWGLVHRDISPQNIMVSLQGDVKVIDFGVARSRFQSSNTGAGLFVGKLRYMAPEQLGGKRIDRRTDVFSVGVLLAELLSGRRYYGEDTDQSIMLHLMTDSGFVSPALQRVKEPLRSVIATAVERDPRKRFGSALAFAEALAPHGRGTAATLRRLILSLWPDADAEERAFLRGAFGDDVASPRSFEDETVRVVFPETARGRSVSGAPDPSVTPDGSTIVRRPVAPAARPSASRAVDVDDDDDATERMVVPPVKAAKAVTVAPSGARASRGMFVSAPTGSGGDVPSLPVALIPSDDDSAVRPLDTARMAAKRSAVVGSTDDDDDDTTIRTTADDLAGRRPRGVPIKDAPIELVEPDERTLRALPEVDTQSSSKAPMPPLPPGPRKR
jgi:serine/threonine protein kinase